MSSTSHLLVPVLQDHSSHVDDYRWAGYCSEYNHDFSAHVEEWADVYCSYDQMTAQDFPDIPYEESDFFEPMYLRNDYHD